MGFRFRKSVSLGKHARINIGKNGVNGVTFGSKGSPHVTVDSRDRYQLLAENIRLKQDIR